MTTMDDTKTLPDLIERIKKGYPIRVYVVVAEDTGKLLSIRKRTLIKNGHCYRLDTELETPIRISTIHNVRLMTEILMPDYNIYSTHLSFKCGVGDYFSLTVNRLFSGKPVGSEVEVHARRYDTSGNYFTLRTFYKQNGKDVFLTKIHAIVPKKHMINTLYCSDSFYLPLFDSGEIEGMTPVCDLSKILRVKKTYKDISNSDDFRKPIAKRIFSQTQALSPPRDTQPNIIPNDSSQSPEHDEIVLTRGRSLLSVQSGERVLTRGRSRSRSPVRYYRSRSPPVRHHRSRSPPTRYRSRSPTRYYRSRPPPASRHRSRSPTRYYRSRSPPVRRHRSRSPTRYYSQSERYHSRSPVRYERTYSSEPHHREFSPVVQYPRMNFRTQYDPAYPLVSHEPYVPESIPIVQPAAVEPEEDEAADNLEGQIPNDYYEIPPNPHQGRYFTIALPKPKTVEKTDPHPQWMKDFIPV